MAFEIGNAYISVGLRAGGALAGLAALNVAAGTTGAAIAAIPAAAGSVASSVTVMGVALSGVSDAVDLHTKAVDAAAQKSYPNLSTQMAKYQVALDKLSPSQRRVTQQLVDMQPAWDSLISAGNEPFLEGVSAFLKDADDLFPILKENLRDTGSILGGMAEDLGDLFASLDFQKSLDAYLKNTEVITQAAADSFVELTDSAITFGGEMDQTAQGFAGFLTDVSSGVSGFLQNLQKYDADFKRIWTAWGTIVDAVLPAVGDAIGEIAHAIAPVFEDIASFLKDNKDSLDEWIIGLAGFAAALYGVSVAGKAVRGISGLIGTFSGLGAAVTTTTGAIGLLAVAVAGAAIAYDAMTTSASEAAQSVLDGSVSQTAALDNLDKQNDQTSRSLGRFHEVQKSAVVTNQEFTDELNKQLAAMTPLEQAQARVAMATANYNDKVKEFGDNSPQAQAAQRDLATATNEEEAAQLRAKDATKDHTDALRDQQNQMLAMSDANIAQRQAVLDLHSAQKDLTTAIRDHGKGSDEAEQAELRLETAQNRVITSTQQQTKVAGEGKTQTDQAKDASDQFTYTNLALAASLGNQASPSVQKFATDMSDSALQAFNAGIKTSGFHYEIKQLPDGRDVYIRTDPETNEVINYREELFKIPPLVVTHVTADGRYTISDNGIKVNNATGAVSGRGRTGLAAGGILPGYTPGEDVHTFVSPTGGVLGLSGGEAIMRPEWTKAVGPNFIAQANSISKSRGVAGARSFMGFAEGGVYPYLPPMATDMSNSLIGATSRDLAVLVKKAIAAAVTAISSGGGGGSPGSGPVVDQVRAAVAPFGWSGGAQWDALSWLISHESGWRPGAQNPTSTAYGLFQFLNSTWGSVGGSKTSNPGLQALYGARYIRSRYGSPIGAKSFWQSHHWYDQGGVLEPGATMAMNGTGKPELVLTQEQAQMIGGGGGPTFSGCSFTVVANDPQHLMSALEQLAKSRGKIRAGVPA